MGEIRQVVSAVSQSPVCAWPGPDFILVDGSVPGLGHAPLSQGGDGVLHGLVIALQVPGAFAPAAGDDVSSYMGVQSQNSGTVSGTGPGLSLF